MYVIIVKFKSKRNAIALNEKIGHFNQLFTETINNSIKNSETIVYPF